MLQFAWNVFGGEKFKFSILQECNKEELWANEQSFIDSCKEPMFNILKDSRNPGKISKEERVKRSERAKKQHIAGKFGFSTWETDPAIVAQKVRKTRIENGSYKKK